MPYSELYRHIVWATKGREPMLDDARQTLVNAAVRAACREQGAVVHAFGCMPEHVHLAVSLPPRLAVSELVRVVKGGTSHLLNRDGETADDVRFAWQAEYGVLSFSKRSLPRVVDYVCNQAAHRAGDRLWADYERMERNRPTPVGGDGAV